MSPGPAHNEAFGAPGIAPTWCSSDKDFVTTALGSSLQPSPEVESVPVQVRLREPAGRNMMTRNRSVS